MSANWAAREGSASPIGVTFIPEDDSYNFALYSKHATSVTLLLYAADNCAHPLKSMRLDHLKNKTGRVWHCRLRAGELEGARYYAYSVDGPHNLGQGHRFDPDKILLDPEARAIFFPPSFSREACRRPGNNAGCAPVGIIAPGVSAFDWTGDRKPRHTHDLVIYELHVRGFTRRDNSGVSAEHRGTFAGLIEKIPYLKELGITAIELMPVFQFDPQEGNYWGYMPISFFALHHSYGSDHGLGEELDEFRAMVKAMHQADIEVILDVVYNHTAEGDDHGPTYSYRGVDNSTYYLLGENRALYRNDSGTGNVLHTANRTVQSMVLHSLRYWVRETHVDGFRFDLASLFTRNDDGHVDLDDPPILAAIQSDPHLRDVRLIAEAWDPASYQLGRTFPGITWLQWNGLFRDQIRIVVHGAPDRVGDLMTRLYGSDDLFPDSLEAAYHAYQSLNFITSHDGFCLHDLLAYNRKHNEANGHNNTDGFDDNHSWNCGWEGEVGAPTEVLALRRRQAKNLLSLLLLSNGTPMLTAGDEFLNTQRGNNNPYNQDNETTWLDWERLPQNAEVYRFCRLMIAFRKAHPSIARSRFWREDVSWYGSHGPAEPRGPSRTLAVHLSGASQNDCDLYMMINTGTEDIGFTIHANGPWRRVVDTALVPPHDIATPGMETEQPQLDYLVRARSVVVLTGPLPGEAFA